MDPKLFERTRELTPKFNDDVCRGYAVQQMAESLPYIDKIIRSAKELFPPGLEYEGRSRGNCIEYFNEITREYKDVRRADVTRHDYYLVKYHFTFDGASFPPLPVLMPFVRDGGIFTHRGTPYMISPSLTDIGFSTTRDGIFIPFKRVRYNFYKTDYSVLEDSTLAITNLYRSPIHHESKKTENKRNILIGNRPYIYTTLSHYFLSKWGFTASMKRFAGVDALVMKEEEIDPKKYPAKQWLKYQSAVFYNSAHPHANIRILIPREQATNPETGFVDDFVKTMVGSFFYIADAFIGEFVNLNDVDAPDFWMLLLGRIIKGDLEPRGAVLSNMEDHMASTDTQLDDITRDSLAEVGIRVNDIYELFHVIMTTLARCFLKTSTDEASMYNKRLSVNPFVLHEFNEMITRMTHKFQTLMKKNYGRDDVYRELRKAFKLKACLNVPNNHGECTVVSSPGDNMIFRITSVLTDQAKAGPNGNSRKETSFIKDPSRVLHASIAEVGSFTNLPKSMPDGRSRINPTVELGHTGVVKRKEKYRALLDDVQRKIEG